MDVIIRNLEPSEYCLLNNFLYDAIFVPEGEKLPPKDIINTKELSIYTKDFGKKDDIALAAQVDSKIVGMVWTRIINDYGHIDDETPSLAISVVSKYRGFGIGTKMMKEMINVLKNNGYSQVSLSVQQKNYAFRMYQKLGFEIIAKNDDEYIMVYRLKSNKSST